MKRLYFIYLFTFISTLLQAQTNYYKFFNDSILRIDYTIGGNFETTEIFPGQMKKEPFYSGSRKNLIDTKNYGTFRYRIFDKKSGKLLFSKGFCDLFQEWQTTKEAKTIKRSFYQSAILPFPKNEIQFTIDQRKRDGNFIRIYSTDINPKDYSILNENSQKYKSKIIIKNGSPKKKVDLVFLAEGYTEKEMGKFINDVHRMTNIIFSESPFDKHKNDFNIYAVKVPSTESGTDIPQEHIYKNTAFNSTFNTFNTPRYLTTSDMKNIYDATTGIPCDQIYILVNTKRYGGGGFYNFISVCSADNELTPKTIVHEFGHGFAGLADEYYTSSVSYNDFYNLKIEPWEPNITTLIAFDEKWENMVKKGTPIPTPDTDKYKNKIGVFEGGGYNAKGIFRPYLDCRMKSNKAKGFCPVCQRAIEDAIEWYCK